MVRADIREAGLVDSCVVFGATETVFGRFPSVRGSTLTCDGLMGVALTAGVLTGVGEFESVLRSGGTFCVVWGLFVEGVGLLVTVVAVTIPRSALLVVAGERERFVKHGLGLQL